MPAQSASAKGHKGGGAVQTRFGAVQTRFSAVQTRFQRRLARPQAWRAALAACMAVAPLHLQPQQHAAAANGPWDLAPQGAAGGNNGGEHRGGHRAVSARAVLPWLLVVRGTLAEGALAALCR